MKKILGYYLALLTAIVEIIMIASIVLIPVWYHLFNISDWWRQPFSEARDWWY